MLALLKVTVPATVPHEANAQIDQWHAVLTLELVVGLLVIVFGVVLILLGQHLLKKVDTILSRLNR